MINGTGEKPRLSRTMSFTRCFRSRASAMRTTQPTLARGRSRISRTEQCALTTVTASVTSGASSGEAAGSGFRLAGASAPPAAAAKTTRAKPTIRGQDGGDRRGEPGIRAAIGVRSSPNAISRLFEGVVGVEGVGLFQSDRSEGVRLCVGGAAAASHETLFLGGGGGKPYAASSTASSRSSSASSLGCPRRSTAARSSSLSNGAPEVAMRMVLRRYGAATVRMFSRRYGAPTVCG
mmetsp:Transcript_23316/g.72027  ORF Transcript_23316/g.72027 Transcript_23316/m.72027 type:complete len:235 (+) Transcript_23316:23-727(+)